MDNQPHNSDASEEAGPDDPETDADEAQGGRAPRRAFSPAWLQPADVAALAQQFPPLDGAQIRQLALDLQQGSTPVDLLLLRLVDAGLAPAAARQFLAEVRGLRDRSGPQMRPSVPAGGEFTAALAAAATSYLQQPGDDQQAANALASRVGWSLERARWFVSANQDLVHQTVARLAAERPADT